MKTPVEYAKLHSPLFLGGKNHGDKLFRNKGLSMEYDTETRELTVGYNGKEHHLVAFEGYEPCLGVKEANEEVGTLIRRGRPPKAQVTTPQDHVFSNGPGKTRD
jgi:hypothetical protein